MISELSFRKDTTITATLRGSVWREALVGTLVYKRNGVVVRTISPPEDPTQHIVAYQGNARRLSGFFGDRKENDAAGQLFFNLKEGSNNVATWILIQHDMSVDGTNLGTFDLPREMTFTRVVTYTGGRTSEEFTGGTVTPGITIK